MKIKEKRAISSCIKTYTARFNLNFDILSWQIPIRYKVSLVKMLTYEEGIYQLKKIGLECLLNILERVTQKFNVGRFIFYIK